MAPGRAVAAAGPRIVIVGAGLAGLRCAHRLWTQGIPVASTVYEADTTHIGGRCRSLRGFFAGGAVHEHGGAFISSSDTAILSLARSLGLKKEHANGGALDSGDYTAWIDDTSYSGIQQGLSDSGFWRIRASITDCLIPFGTVRRCASAVSPLGRLTSATYPDAARAGVRGRRCCGCRSGGRSRPGGSASRPDPCSRSRTRLR
ncbi:NAD(P)-binding protein [Streptomyces sp. NBC_01443]|uniref:NAD(P)-binding protein n=1 Tax=Streptomyces sp. NBC_01443 TaxID=2903868 RepID=UPI00338D4985